MLKTEELHAPFVALGNALFASSQVTKERVGSGDVGRGEVGVAGWAVTRLCCNNVKGNARLSKRSKDLPDVVEGDGSEEF